MSKGPLARGFKRARDINSTYSLFDRAFQIVGLLFPGAVAAGLASWALSNVTWFWTQYGIAGAIAVGIVLGLVILVVQLAAEFKLIGAVEFEGTPQSLGVEVAAPQGVMGPTGRAIARSAIVTAGTTAWHPQYRVEFASSGRNAELYVRFSRYASGFIGGGGWTAPVTVKLSDLDRFIQGESLTVPIMYSTQTPEGLRWAFGCEPDIGDQGYPKHMLGPDCYYQGAVMLISHDEVVEWCFFVGEAEKMDAMPKIIGEHMWNHVYEWTGGAPPNRDPRRLFR